MAVAAAGKGCRRGNEENNEESEETPNTTRQTVQSMDSPPTPLLNKAEWTEVEGGREEERRGERRGRERGSGGNKDVSVPFPGTWPELGGGKAYVGLGTKGPMMMRSDQEIPFPETQNIRVSETWQRGQSAEKAGQGECGGGRGDRARKGSKSNQLCSPLKYLKKSGLRKRSPELVSPGGRGTQIHCPLF